MRRVPPLPTQKRDGSRVWRTKPLLELVGWFEDAAADLAADCEHVIRRAVLDHDDGTSGGGDVKVAGGRYGEDGANNGRVPSVVIDQAGDDPVAVAMRRLVGRVIVMREAMLVARAEAAFLRGLDVETARRLVRDDSTPPGSGYCTDCNRWVAGGRDDRLRGGRCDTCRKRHERTIVRDGGLAEPSPAVRPRILTDRAGLFVGATTRTSCGATKGRGDVEYVCNLPVHELDVDHEWTLA